MVSFIIGNAGTILITLFLILIVAGIIRSLINDRKNGRSACGCGGSCAHCGGCASRGTAAGNKE